MASIPAWSASQIYIPHVPAPGGGFGAELILENQTTNEQTAWLRVWTAKGTLLSEFHVDLDPQEIRVVKAETWNESGEAGYLTMEQSHQITAGLAYLHGPEQERVAFQPAITEPARVWRFYTGDWSRVVDAMVIVGNLCNTLEIRARQFDAEGSPIGDDPLTFSVEPGNKFTYVMGNDFENIPGGFIEFAANQSVYAMGLRASRDNLSLIAANQAIAVSDDLAARQQLSQARIRWNGTGTNLDYSFRLEKSCFCAIFDVEIAVRNGRIATVTNRLDEDPLPDERLHELFTIDQLFDLVEKTLAEAPDDYRFDYDQTSGFPTGITIDPFICGVDDAKYYGVSEFRALRTTED